MDTQIQISYVDMPGVEETFADFVRQVAVKDQVVRIELCVTRMNDPHPNEARTGTAYTVARIALPIPAALALREHLTLNIAELEKQGLLKRLAVPPSLASNH